MNDVPLLDRAAMLREGVENRAVEGLDLCSAARPRSDSIASVLASIPTSRMDTTLSPYPRILKNAFYDRSA